MCKISPNLKLCTCATKDATSLKHYWILSRPNNSDIFLLGEVMLPMYLDVDTTRHNDQVLLESLNRSNCFDVALDIKNKDILSYILNVPTRNLSTHLSTKKEGGTGLSLTLLRAWI